MVKKAPKRKNEDKSVTDETKKVKPTPLESYQAGGLSSLFGKSVDDTVVEQDVVKGQTAIERPKRRKNVPKEKENGEEKPVETKEASETEEKTTDSAKKDRLKQRENRTKGKSNARAVASENAKTLFVGNMPLTMNEKAIRRIFADYGTISSVRMRSLIPTNEKLTKRVAHLTGKYSDKQNSLNFYIKFENEESVEKALQYNGTKLEEHTIRVDKCDGKKTFGKDLAVFVGNLPFDITEDTLNTFFTEQIGPVDAVRIVRDKATGKGKGFAFVNFKDDSSASLALSMETIKMDKRDLRITKVMKKVQLNKIETAKKRTGGFKKRTDTEIKGKMENFKFSTKKARSDEQNERRALKKSAKKAINKKKQAKKGRLMQ